MVMLEQGSIRCSGKKPTNVWDQYGNIIQLTTLAFPAIKLVCSRLQLRSAVDLPYREEREREGTQEEGENRRTESDRASVGWRGWRALGERKVGGWGGGGCLVTECNLPSS